MIKSIEELKRDLRFAQFNRKVIEDRIAYGRKVVADGEKELSEAYAYEDAAESALIAASGEPS